jgi:hypothetical protein
MSGLLYVLHCVKMREAAPGYVGPHPEELAKQVSRRMDATRGLAAILRDGASRLLRMRTDEDEDEDRK